MTSQYWPAGELAVGPIATGVPAFPAFSNAPQPSSELQAAPDMSAMYGLNPVPTTENVALFVAPKVTE